MAGNETPGRRIAGQPIPVFLSTLLMVGSKELWKVAGGK